jgi:phosphatidylglycerol:prolipoprotein diacylglycerol transferase
MHPRLISTPFYVLHTFGVILFAAYVTALWWLLRGVKRERIDGERAASLGLWILVGAILGAKALMVVRSLPEYLTHPSDLWSLATLQAAGDFYGGFIGALAAALIFFLRHPEVPRWRFADLAAPSIALGQAIGRIGCLMAGDDFGRPTHLPWAVTFHDQDAADIGGAPLGVPLHPVQIYESAACLGIFLILVRLARRKRFAGEIILAYSMMYAVARFFLEYLRGDMDRGFVFGGMLSTSQFIAILVLIAAVPLWMYTSKTRRL